MCTRCINYLFLYKERERGERVREKVRLKKKKDENKVLKIFDS